VHLCSHTTHSHKLKGEGAHLNIPYALFIQHLCLLLRGTRAIVVWCHGLCAPLIFIQLWPAYVDWGLIMAAQWILELQFPNFHHIYFILISVLFCPAPQRKITVRRKESWPCVNYPLDQPLKKFMLSHVVFWLVSHFTRLTYHLFILSPLKCGIHTIVHKMEMIQRRVLPNYDYRSSVLTMI